MATVSTKMSDSLLAMENLTAKLHAAFIKLPEDRENLFGGKAIINELKLALQIAPGALEAARLDNEHAATNREHALKLVPVTEIYEQTPLHTKDEAPDMRSYRIADFKGDRETCAKDTYACIDWLNRLMRMCDNKQLTHECCKSLIQTHATHEAGRTVRNAINDSKSLLELVIDLEVNYAGLMQPDLALETCRNITRNDGETLRALGERIRLVAEMATRARDDPQKAALQLANDTFLAAIRPSLKVELRSKLDDRRRQGENAPDYTEMTGMAHTIDETRSANEKIFRNRKGNSGTLRYIPEDDENMTTSSNEEDDGYYAENLNEAINLVKTFSKRGKPFRGNYRRQPSRTRKPYKPENKGRALLAQQFEEYDESGEFLTLHYIKTDEQGGRRLRIADLNVLPHECARCGIAGHRATGPDANKCPLRMYMTQPEPCRACNKGGHEAKVCPRTPNLEKN